MEARQRGKLMAGKEGQLGKGREVSQMELRVQLLPHGKPLPARDACGGATSWVLCSGASKVELVFSGHDLWRVK